MLAVSVTFNNTQTLYLFYLYAGSLSHYLANMGRGVPEIKMPLVPQLV